MSYTVNLVMMYDDLFVRTSIKIPFFQSTHRNAWTVVRTVHVYVRRGRWADRCTSHFWFILLLLKLVYIISFHDCMKKRRLAHHTCTHYLECPQMHQFCHFGGFPNTLIYWLMGKFTFQTVQKLGLWSVEGKCTCMDYPDMRYHFTQNGSNKLYFFKWVSECW